ncbi:MAG: hydroxymethylbilane synthase [Fluviibacter sp.]
MSKPLVIASRESRLAMWQAKHVQSRLQAQNPDRDVQILGMTTRGDQILDRPLAAIGGKGLFIKELEVAMAEGRADLAVHSMKDVPMEMPEGFVLAAISAREDPRDAFVSPRYAALVDLPAGAIVGTSSLRREAQLRAKFPHLVIKPLRGNLDTRLKKLDAGEYDAIILAAAGLVRLGLADRIRARIDPAEMLPAPGQGALGIEICAGQPDNQQIADGLADAETAACVSAERAFSRRLGGSCHLPIAGFAVGEPGQQFWLRGLVASVDGTQIVAGECRGAWGEAEALGLALAEQLLAQGADRLIDALNKVPH